jgi:hypothetical protein
MLFVYIRIIMVKDESNFIRFIYYITQEYLERTYNIRFPII